MGSKKEKDPQRPSVPFKAPFLGTIEKASYVRQKPTDIELRLSLGHSCDNLRRKPSKPSLVAIRPSILSGRQQSTMDTSIRMHAHSIHQELNATTLRTTIELSIPTYHTPPYGHLHTNCSFPSATYSRKPRLPTTDATFPKKEFSNND